MEPEKKAFAALVVSSPYDEIVSDFRARVALRHAEALERRQVDLAGQTANVHSPSERIRIWERLHQIALPRNPAHQLLHVIAADTALSLEEVQTEQTQRTASPPNSHA